MSPNKLLPISPNGDPVLAKAMRMGAEDYDVHFVRWEATSQAIVQRRLQEIALDLCEETKDMNYNDLMSHCVAKINETSARVFFHKSFLTRKTVHHMNRINAGVDGQNKRWRYNHLLQGFYTAQAPIYIEKETPMLTDDDVIRHFAYTKVLCGLTST